jgi:hypothetical protein
MTPEPLNEAQREFERQFGMEFGALGHRLHERARRFRRGTGVAKPGCPCPE